MLPVETVSSLNLFKQARDVYLRSLRVAQLRNILRIFGLSNYGLKAALQERIKTQMNAYYATKRVDVWLAMTFSIISEALGPEQATSRFASSGVAIPTAYPSLASAAQPSTISTNYNNNNSNQMVNRNINTTKSNQQRTAIKFRPSPFYELIRPIAVPRMIPVWSPSPFSFNLEIPADVVTLLESTKHYYKDMEEAISMKDIPENFPSSIYSLYLMSYAHEQQHQPNSVVDVYFPHKPTVFCRGKKAQKFFSRSPEGPVFVPVDLTTLLINEYGKISITASINVEFEIASKPFVLMVYLVRNYPVSSIHRLLSNTPTCLLSAEKVVEKYFKDKESDVVASKLILPLKCPLLYTDIHIPVRGFNCNHLQCFDLYNYLRIQKQSSTWTCPICHQYQPNTSTGIGLMNMVKFNSFQSKLELSNDGAGGLQICGYTLEIIREMETKYGGNFDENEVEVRHDGEWIIRKVHESIKVETPKGKKRKREDDEEDDLGNETFELNSSPLQNQPVFIDLTED